MNIYLPIAEVSVYLPMLLAISGGVGLLSGMFGVGGGFLMTPLLIFVGIPPSIAVATQSNQLVATGISGVLAHRKQKHVDFKLGTAMLSGSVVGTVFGVYVFTVLKNMGQLDLVVSLLYVTLLSSVGTLMFVESIRTWWRSSKKQLVRRKLHPHSFLHGLPFRLKFPVSGLYMSALLPAMIGVLAGFLVAVMGVGGGFLLVPIMIYFLGMPTSLVAGTSLFQVIFTTALATFLQAVTNHNVDIILAAILIIGGAIGAQFGSRLIGFLKGEQARGLLAIIVLSVALKLLYDLILPPEDLYSMLVQK